MHFDLNLVSDLFLICALNQIWNKMCSEIRMRTAQFIEATDNAKIELSNQV